MPMVWKADAELLIYRFLSHHGPDLSYGPEFYVGDKAQKVVEAEEYYQVLHGDLLKVLQEMKDDEALPRHDIEKLANHVAVVCCSDGGIEWIPDEETFKEKMWELYEWQLKTQKEIEKALQEG